MGVASGTGTTSVVHTIHIWHFATGGKVPAHAGTGDIILRNGGGIGAVKYFVAGVGEVLHDDAHRDHKPGGLHERVTPRLSRRREDQIVWEADEPFSITRITPDSPFGWDAQGALPAGAVFQIVSGPPLRFDGTDPNVAKLFKVTFAFGGHLFDPDFECVP